jgi:YtfJ family uncharacterized protein
MRKLFLLLPLLFAASPLFADAIQLGKPISPLAIETEGELLLEADKVSYAPWFLQHPEDKVHVLQYMAGTKSASKINEPFTDALKDSIDYTLFHVTTIINLDDAMWGTSGFVKSEVEKNKRRYPLSSLILDRKGTGRENWQLEKKTSSIVVTDRQGAVIYVKHGAMDEHEIEQALDMIRAQVNS